MIISSPGPSLEFILPTFPYLGFGPVLEQFCSCQLLPRFFLFIHLLAVVVRVGQEITLRHRILLALSLYFGYQNNAFKFNVEAYSS